MRPEQMEVRRQQLNLVENAFARGEAIALFNQSHHLVLFNQNVIDIWGLSSDWLKKHLNAEAR